MVQHVPSDLLISGNSGFNYLLLLNIVTVGGNFFFLLAPSLREGVKKLTVADINRFRMV